MSSGQRQIKRPFNKSIMRDGLVVILRKDGRVKAYKDPKTGDVIKDKK